MREQLHPGKRVQTPEGEGTIIEIVNANSKIVGSNTRIVEQARIRVVLSGPRYRWFQLSEIA